MDINESPKMEWTGLQNVSEKCLIPLPTSRCRISKTMLTEHNLPIQVN